MVLHPSPLPDSATSGQPHGGASKDNSEWTDFDSASFKNNIKQRRKTRSRRDPEEQGRATRPDAVSVAPTWMKAPVNCDASWMPVVPPSPTQREHRRGTDDEGRGDDASREGTDSITLQSPSSRRRPIRNSDELQPQYDHTTDRYMPDSLSSPSSQRIGRSEPPRGGGPVVRAENDTPVRRGRAPSHHPLSESPREQQRIGSRQPSPHAYQSSVSRARSGTPTGRRRSGTHTPAMISELSPVRAPLERPPQPNIQKLRASGVAGCSSSVGPGLPRPIRTPRAARYCADDGSVRTQESARTLDPNIGRDVNFGTAAVQNQCILSPHQSRKEGGLMDRLFGSQAEDDGSDVNRRESAFTFASESTFRLPDKVHSRILLSATVYQNAATSLWIATINTNQRGVATNPATASKYLKAFSFTGEKEARESAIANAPPKMLPFNEHPKCFICSGKFTVFRRPSHCRNCGVCICSGCTVMWSSKMIPETYNLKNEKNVNICTSCDFLSDSFKRALSNGSYEDAIALYGTGNINLRTPLSAGKKDKKGEIMHPIHCAVEGGNMNIVRWLLEERFCPIRKIASGNGKQKRGIDIPILTSRGRSALQIAMSNLQVELIRYLVVDQNVSVYEVKDLTLSLRVLEQALVAIPRRTVPLQTREIVARWADDGYGGDDASDISGSLPHTVNDDSTQTSRRIKELGETCCIICYDNAIDCVITPCGHQICCLVCSENMTMCPVCNTQCSFIRIFKP